jgi:hypothetical protein
MSFVSAARGAAALTALLAASALASQAEAWGATGHRLIGEVGEAALPADLPAFLHTPEAVEAVGELAREPDRSKASGKVHDTGRDPGHFVDVDDAGKILGGPDLANLPPTRSDYETALHAVGSDSYHAGYLPYSIIDGWQQVAKDFAYWRILTAAIPREQNPAHKLYMQRDLAWREQLTLRDLGYWAHFVGDGSQPLHITIHHDGWGDYPNQGNHTAAKIHGLFEGDFVHKYVTYEMVRAHLPATAPDCGCGIERWTANYLVDTYKLFEPVYAMYRDGDFSSGTPKGEDFAARQIAVGAAQLRDMTLAAWKASDAGQIGFPVAAMVSVKDVEAGAKDPYDALHGLD